ncbi:MAG: flavin reductase family protein [Alphaproteobacteria bacterium]|nr:flavin reductase family protein [Alphaproteobacteria bacterium]
MTVDSHSFRNALGCFATGVTVVTTVSGEGRSVGVTVSAFSSVSLQPPLVMVCLGRQTSSVEAFCSGFFAVNVLREDQKEIAIRFATRADDKWAKTNYETWEGGSPILPGCVANLECRVAAVHEAGDHLIIVGEVVRLAYAGGGHPLLYFRSAYAGLGTAL